MINFNLEACFTLGIGAFLMALAVPLMLRKVPMNRYYGFRTTAAFESEKAWYEINAAGGKIHFWACVPILLVGVCKLFLSGKTEVFYLNLFAFIGPLIVGFLGDRIVKSKRKE